MRLLILTAFFAFTTFQPSRADPHIFELKNQFEHRISAYWSQKFPFGKGTFYAFEKAGDPASQARPEPHRMVAIDGFSGAKTSLTAPDVERSIRSFYFGKPYRFPLKIEIWQLRDRFPAR